MKSQTKKLLLHLLGIIILDTILILSWIQLLNPDPSITIIVIYAIPFTFLINLILAGLYFLAKKRHSVVLYINAFIAPVITATLFLNSINTENNVELDEWTFFRNDTLFRIERFNELNSYTFTYSSEPGLSNRISSGKIQYDGENILLIADTIIYRIENNVLIGFENDSIKLTQFN